MNNSEYMSYDGLGLAQLVRSGEVSPAELVSCAHSLIEQCNPDINAVLEVFPDSEQILASAAGGAAFSGVPFLIKDLVIQAEGRASETPGSS